MKEISNEVVTTVEQEFVQEMENVFKKRSDQRIATGILEL